MSRGTLLAGALITMTVATGVAAGQAIAPDLQPGLMPYQSYHGGDIDKINLSNGILNVQIPLISYPQRGGKLKLDFALAFNSKPLVYQKFCTPQIPKGPAPTCNWAWLQFIYGQSDYLAGWRVADMQSISQFGYDEKVPISNGPSTTDYDWIQIQTGDGSIHPSGQISGSTGQITLDGSNFASIGWDPTAGCASTCYILDANGVMYNNTSWTSTIREDSDGNEISNASGNLTDTVGRTIPIFPSPTTTFTSQQAAVCKGSLPVYEISVWQVPGVNGSTQSYTFCYAQVPYLAPNPNQSPFTPQSGNLVELQSVALPNGLSWIFGYDATNGTSTAYGDLTSITFPTGGTISYTYQTIQSTATPAAHTTRWIASRTDNANDGQGAHTWQYAFVLGTSVGGLGQSSQTTTVTDPSLNQTVHTFSNALFNGYETLAQYYNGSSSSGSLLRSVATTYNYLSPSGYFYPAQVMNAFPASQTTTLENGLASVKTWSYCCSISLNQEGATGTYGLPSDEKDYDFASSGTGTLLKEKQTSYEFQTNANYLTANLLNLKASEKTLNGSGAEMSLDSYTYDESGYSGISSGITTQHGSAPFSVRGELTTTTAWLNGGTSPQSHTKWYDTGEVYQSMDPLGHAITYGYSGTYAGSLPTTVSNALGQSTTYTYDINTGQKMLVTDPNSQVTTYSYNDPLGRLTDVLYPDVDPASNAHGESKYKYNDSASPVNFVLTRVMSPTQTMQEEVDVDGFGREWYTKLTTDSQGTTYTEKTYDGLGRLYQEWNPTRCSLPGSTSCTSEPTWGTTTHQYDALSRPIVLTHADGSTQQSAYTGNTVNFYDETSRHWQRISDALGRLTKILEPNSSNTPTLETDYGYDALGNLLRVDQWGGPVNSTGDRIRTFTYDSLSRLLTATNPETGTVTYKYLTSGGALCAGDLSEPCSKIDARSISTTFAYDALNRITGKQASGINYAYAYDTGTNGIGRLTYASNNVNANTQYASYDPMGRLTRQTYWTPSSPNNTSIVVTATYDLAGDVSSITYPDGRVVKQTWDGAEHLQTVTYDNWNGTKIGYNYLSSASYWANGAPQAAIHGNGVADGQRLNNRLQPIGIGPVHIGADGPGTYTGNISLANRVYCYGPAATAAQTASLPCSSLGLANNGNILQILDSLNGNNSQAFSYDNLNRLASFTNGNGAMQQTYSIDAWGNMSQVTPGTVQSNVFFGTNNQITSSGYGYDASGNLTSFNNGISTVAYTYDAEGEMATANNGSATYTYDAEGNRVRKDAGGTWTEYIHFDGQPIAEKNADGTWSDYIYANGQRMARADSFDIRIHMSGTNCSNCGTSPNMFAGTTSLTAANGYVIRAGDLLTWRQYQDGSALGGLFFGLLNSSGTYVDGTSLQDTDHQPILADTTKNTWHVRTVDLSSFAGMKIDLIDPFDSTNAPAGAWDIYYGDITLVSTDGTFIPIYSRSTMNLSLATAPGVSGFSAITEKVADTSPLTTSTYYHGDQIGSARLLTAGTGWPVSSNTFYPYGQGPTSGTNHYLFAGKERDAESGNDYFGARYYGSSMGRFMSPDDFGGHLEDPQTLNKYAYAGNNPLRYTDPSGHDFWQSCKEQSNTCGNQVIGKGTDGKDITQLVSGTTTDGKFSATVITSASLGQAGSGNTANVDGTGVHITTGTGTDSQQSGQGIFIAGTQSADIKGTGTGWDQFNFHIDGNDVAHGGLTTGTATYLGQGGHQGMVNAINSMASGDNIGPFQYPGEDHYNGFHPGATNARFSPGDYPEILNYGPSPHFPVPGAGTSVPNFHIDNGTGPGHVVCAKFGALCY